MFRKKPLKKEHRFYGADLHVHTPASSCYKGPKTDEEYLNILRRYSEKNIKIIAITDHNTLGGYKRYLYIKGELEKRYNVLLDFSGTDEIDLALKELRSKLDLFNDILILPGVELEVKPGIHLVFIFNPGHEHERIEEFIVQAGYYEEVQGLENPNIVPEFDVVNALEKFIHIEGLAIAAHVDSNKGIYNDLQGSFRVAIFKHSRLNGISYNNPLTAEKIRNMLKDPLYKRSEPIAFLQSSDYHGEGDVGSKITYFKLDRICYESLVAAFNNPSECISPTQHPENINIIKEVIDGPNTITISSLNVGGQDEVIFSSCALLNEGYGSIVIGISPQNNSLIGVTGTEDENAELVTTLLKEIEPEFDAEMKFYPFGDGRHIIVVRLLGLFRTIYSAYGSKVYLLQKNEVKCATILEIQDHIETRLLKRYDFYLNNQFTRVESLLEELNSIMSMSKLYTHSCEIERQCYRLRDIIDIRLVIPKMDPAINKKFDLNGQPDGNAVIIGNQTPHLQSAYLRCSAPQMVLEDKEMKLRFEGNHILIVPDGGVYLKSGLHCWELFHVNPTYTPVIMATVKPSFLNRYADISLVLWLKSTINLWLSYIKFGTTNLHNPAVFFELMVPVSPLFKPRGYLEQIGERMLDLERNFLQQHVAEHFCDSSNGDDRINEHNRTIGKIGKEIDLLFCNEFNLTSDEIDKICNSMADLNMFFGLANESERIADEVAFAFDEE